MKKLIIILFFVPLGLFSQVSDFGLWSSININYALNKKNDFNFEQSIKTIQNSTNWTSIFSELSYYHSLNKYFSLGAGYRFSINNMFDYTLNSHRFTANFKAKKKINNFYLSYRLQFQNEYLGVKHRENWQTPKSYLRNLIKIKYKLSKKIKPYVSYEFYYLFGQDFYFTNKYRITGGINYKFDKKNSINIYCRYQKTNFKTDINLYILGISYKYNL